MNNSYIVQEARSKLGPNYVLALIPYAVIYAVFLHIGLFCYIVFPWSLFIVVPALLALIIFYGPVEYGMLLFYSKLYKNAVPNNRECLDGFSKHSFAKAVFLHSLRLIYVFLCSLLLFIPGIILSSRFSQSMLIQRNNPEMNITDALDESGKMMKGKKLQYFKLNLRLVPLYLLAIITAGIGFIFIAPYKNMLKMVFYRRVIRGDTDFLPNIDKPDKKKEKAGKENTLMTEPAGMHNEAVIDYENYSENVNAYAGDEPYVSAAEFNEQAGTGKKASDKKSVKDRISIPRLDKYDEFDKSPEQLRLEQELAMLIEDEGSQADMYAVTADSVPETPDDFNMDDEHVTITKTVSYDGDYLTETVITETIEESAPANKPETTDAHSNGKPETVNTRGQEKPETPPDKETPAIDDGAKDRVQEARARNARLEELLAKRQAMQNNNKKD